MDSIVPTAAFAEDQQHAEEVLIVHVAHRTANALTAIATVGTLVRRVAYPQTTPRLLPALLRGNAAALLLGVVAGVALTEGKMQGEDKIAWQDRSYRLLSNENQNAIDRWSAGGALAGFTWFGITTGKKGGFLVRSIGGAGLGSVLGLASYAAYTQAQKAGLVDDLMAKVQELRKQNGI
ncbi:hypothetical protein BC830DRAFT_1103155 [Chytriomyces sp. MP71]|nr:hypothetical protein BC830DRAFT_1103155 [Chytriomyces sp. MP71]